MIYKNIIQLLIIVSCFQIKAQENISFLYPDVKIDFYQKGQIIEQFYSIPNFIDEFKFDNKKTLTISSENLISDGYYKLFLEDANGLYNIKCLITVRKDIDSTIINIHDAVGIYMLDANLNVVKNPLPVDINNAYEDEDYNPFNDLSEINKRNNDILNDYTFQSYEENNLIINDDLPIIKNRFKEKLLNSKRYYGLVPHKVLREIIFDCRRLKIRATDQENFIKEIINRDKVETTNLTKENYIEYYQKAMPFAFFFNNLTVKHFSENSNLMFLPEVNNLPKKIFISKKVLKKNSQYLYKIDSVLNKERATIQTLGKKADFNGMPFFLSGLSTFDTILRKNKLKDLDFRLASNQYSYEVKSVNDSTYIMDGLLVFNDTINRKYFTSYFNDGLMDGPYRYINNKTEFGNYKNGVKNGWVTKTDFEGNILSKFHYTNGYISVDSTHYFYDYYNFLGYEKMTPKSHTKVKFNETTYNYEKTGKEFYDKITLQNPTNKINLLFLPNKNLLIFREKNNDLTYEVVIEKENSSDVFRFKTVSLSNRKEKESYKVEVDYKTGKNKPGGKIYEWIADGENYKENDDNGLYKGFGIKNNGELFWERNSDLISLFLQGIEAVFKPISEFFGLDGFGVTYDTQNGYGILVEKNNVTIPISLDEYYEYQFSQKINQPYFEDYLISIRNEEIISSFQDSNFLSEFKNYLSVFKNESINEILSTEILENCTSISDLENILKRWDLHSYLNSYLNNTSEIQLNNANKYFKLNESKQPIFFHPNSRTLYRWANIGTPTFSGEVRFDAEGSGLLEANRGSRIHKGTDYYNPVGAPVLSPAFGKIVSINYADKKTANQDRKVRSINIETTNGTIVKVIYVTPITSLKINDFVDKNTVIGVSPDMRRRFSGKPNEKKIYSDKMRNHIHMEIILKDGTLTNRSELFKY
jgi:hypothetical protein